jgi:heparinase II/III-like protein
VILPLPKTWSRLSRMSWDEFRTRLGQEFGKRAEYMFHRAGLLGSQDGIRANPNRTAHFFFSPEQLHERIALLKKHLPSVVEGTIEEANEIMQHRFRLLGYRDLNYTPEIDWHLDAVHGRRAPLKPWYKVRFLDFEEVGDHKVTWELNRHQHLMTLAKAWAFTTDAKYLQEIDQQLNSWRSANPYPMGINWGSSLEVAFRSISWLWVRNLITQNTVLPARFEHGLLRGLARNGRYIERYLSTYFSPNTHLIGEAVALFFVGTLCPGIRSAQRWQQKGLSILLAEAERQVRPDGVYFEQSLYYHVYALDFFLHARVLAARNRISVPESFDRVLERMLDVVRVLSCIEPPQNFGDDDGGRLFNPRRNRVEHMTDSLAIGATLFGSARLRASATVTEEAIWLFGHDALTPVPSDSSRAISSTAFADGGLYVIASSGEHSAQLLVDAGPHGTGHGGHGHADALSVRVSTKERSWLIDPGSYVYITPGNERNLFRGTAAHNTLLVDKLDQAVPEGPFAWSALPDVRAERWLPGSLFTFFSGIHTGYCRLPDPVVHRRMIFHLHGEYWLVRDIADGRVAHELEIFWHFAPDLNVAASENALIATSRDDKLAVLTASMADWDLAIKEGFVSPAYGEKQAAPVGVCRTRAQLPTEHAALLVPLHAGEPAGRFRLVAAKSSTGAVQYLYERGDITDCVVFGDCGGSWSCGLIRSDAALFFIGAEGHEIVSFAACSASFVELDGRAVFTSARAVERLEWTRAGGASASEPRSLEFFDREGLTTKSPVL